MSQTKRRNYLDDSEEGLMVLKELSRIDADNSYKTGPSYSSKASYIDGLIPFVDKHMDYLNDNPHINPVHYLANLRLMTKIRK